MALVDEIELHIKAGRGGDGVVRWRHEKNREYGGPSGGDGGKGGSVFAVAIRDISVLIRYRSVKEFKAEDGETGKSKAMHGKDGADLLLDMPVGSIITNRQTDERFELLREGERIQLLAGGLGGLGNQHFKGSVNQQPTKTTPGKLGEQADFLIELQLIADAGLIGLPNAGKSSLLNALTNAHARIGSYAFTTLEPNLGVMDAYILADIPGLIEGAAEGKGLGHKFLRHIRRTKALLHLISLENPDVLAAYQTIRSELADYDTLLAQKKEIIILTKTDMADSDVLRRARSVLLPFNKRILEVSVFDPESIKNIRRELINELH